MRTSKLLMAVLVTASTAHAADKAEDWRKIDFDADLTTYLIDVGHITKSANSASVIELNVPGRTSIATGSESHTVLTRNFDCAKGTETLGDIVYFRNLGRAGKKLDHPDVVFPVRRGSMDEIMFNVACNGAQPPAASGYGSVAEAVHRAFMDAIKLPPEQSVRTRRPFAPPGGPLQPSPSGAAR